MRNHQNRRRFLLTSVVVGSGLALGKKSLAADKPIEKMFFECLDLQYHPPVSENMTYRLDELATLGSKQTAYQCFQLVKATQNLM